MRAFASRIVEELKAANHWAVYEADLVQFWPASSKNREARIARFAQEHGLRLRFYKAGLCAVFDKQADEPSNNGNKD
jgi:hypothetical protein